MAQNQQDRSEQAANHDRLNSWKDIANYLGKGVRTVQRWEKELDLPVHRIHGKAGEIVYASRRGIDEWQAAREKRRIGWRRVLVAAAVVVLLALGISFTWRATKGDWQPASWKVQGEKLLVFDHRGRTLWEHRFAFAPGEPASKEGGRLPVIQDLEDDGAKELLFPLLTGSPEHDGLHCFNSDGSLRFSHRPTRTVRFGDTQYGPPFHLTQFVVTGSANKKSLWLVCQHMQWFPAVVEKLDPEGKVLGEYWNNGHILTIAETELGGRKVLLAGGTSNEHGGASLAVLDYEKPSGSAPAANLYYRCQNCPAGQPLKFLIFPRMEISREVNARPFVTGIHPQPDGKVVVAVMQTGAVTLGGTQLLVTAVFYTLNAQFQVVEAEVGDVYRRTHAQLEVRGRLKHRFGQRCESEMLPVLAWDGERFVASGLQPSAISDQQARKRHSDPPSPDQ